MTLTVITPPAEEALLLAEAKTFLRIGHDGEDGLVTDLVAGARARLEEAGGLALVTRTMRRTFDTWPSSLSRAGIRLRPTPAATLVSVSIVDPEDNSTDVTGQLELYDDRLRVRTTSWCPPIPIGGHARVDFEAGFGGAADIPKDLVQAMKLILLDAYRRNVEAAMPEAAQAIIAARREVLL